MKKRTVITTEKREVWVIHPPARAVHDPLNDEMEVSKTVPDLLSQGDIQTDTPTQTQIDEKQALHKKVDLQDSLSPRSSAYLGGSAV